MTKRQTRQYEMLVRIRKFGNAQKEKFPEGSEGSKAFAAITAAMGEIESYANAKLTGRREGMTKLEVKQALLARISTLARTARKLAKTVPGADIKFPMPVRQSDVAVLTSGRLFLQEAPAVKDAFIRCGLPATFVEDLQQAIAALEGAIANGSEGRTGAVVSMVAIRTALAQGVDAVDSLDAFVANALGHDANVMAAWKRDRHVATAAKNPTFDEPAAETPATITVATDTAAEPLRRAS